MASHRSSRPAEQHDEPLRTHRFLQSALIAVFTFAFVGRAFAQSQPGSPAQPRSGPTESEKEAAKEFEKWMEKVDREEELAKLKNPKTCAEIKRRIALLQELLVDESAHLVKIDKLIEEGEFESRLYPNHATDIGDLLIYFGRLIGQGIAALAGNLWSETIRHWKLDRGILEENMKRQREEIAALLEKMIEVCAQEKMKYSAPPPGKPQPPEHSQATPGLFRTGEVQLLAYGTGGVGHGQQNVTDEHTVRQTMTVTETTFVPEIVDKDIPCKPGLTPVATDVPVTTKHDVTTRKTVKTTRNAAAIQGGFGGLGGEAKVFVTQNIGLGLEGDWMDDSSIGTVLGTVTARFPMGSNAPYLFGGTGVQFGDETKAVGKLGGGIEHRFSPTTGVFVDAAWMFADHENAAVFRAGVSLVFGPQELPPPSKK